MKKFNEIVISRATKVRGELVEPGKVIPLPTSKTEQERRDELVALVGMGKALPATSENIARVKKAMESKAAARGSSAGSDKKREKALADREKDLEAREKDLAEREKALEKK